VFANSGTIIAVWPRIDAQAAGSEVEELIWTVQHFEPGKQRMAFMVDVGEPAPFGATH
jgi:hypothetical protein